MQGSYDVDKRELYTPVTSSVATLAEDGASGGYFESGARIYYTVDGYDFDTGKGGGITGNGWYRGDVNSPFYNYTTQQLNDAVRLFNTTGNMDNVFKEWGMKEGIDRSNFVKNTILGNCWELLM